MWEDSGALLVLCYDHDRRPRGDLDMLQRGQKRVCSLVDIALVELDDL